MRDYTIGVVGNPNCGKTTLFNALTGARQRVGNWPGVTVDRKTGAYRHEGHRFEVIDTPGIYSLSAASVDEEVARDFVLSGEADLIVNIVDASNIERNLYLTTLLLEMRPPLLVALNMMDVAEGRRLAIDVDALARQLGCPVIPMVASRNQGVRELKEAILKAAAAPAPASAQIAYPVEIQEAAAELAPLVRDAAASRGWAAPWAALKLLENDEQAIAAASPEALAAVARLQKRIEGRLEDDTDILIASARYGFIHWLTRDAVRQTGQASDSLSDRLDRVFLSRVWGLPIFLFSMYLMFMVTINLGGAFIDFFDLFAGALFVDGFGHLLESLRAPAWLVTVLAGGLGGGIQTMATFIPPIGAMFLCLCFLEDSGYMARAAFLMDRLMRVIGLPGKSFIPLLVGFGCNVPAIMATRTLESERDRTLTVMMNPFMSCGARLPVYALFAAAFFPTGGQNLVFLLYLIGIAFAVFTGLVLKHTLLQGEATPFVMELPPYHRPSVKTVLLRAADRLQTFLFKAGKVLVPVIVVLAFLNSLGTDGSFGNEDREHSALAAISRSITPVLEPLGVTAENWPATVGVFTGIFAKEAVVGTLDALYGRMDAAAAGAEEEAAGTFRLGEAIAEAFATIPANLAGVADTLLDPLGLSVGDVSDLTAAAAEQEVQIGTFGAMVSLFGTRAAAFAYLLFILLYFPCVAAIAAVYRETSLKWTLFTGAWTTFLGYFAAVVFYQAATFGQHPASSAAWLAAMPTALALIVAAMKKISRKEMAGVPRPAAARA